MSTSEQKRRDGRNQPEERKAKLTVTVCDEKCEHYNPVTDRTKESCPYRIKESCPKVKKVWI